MDHRRKQAYRYQLYMAMLEIRPIAWRSFSLLNPFAWKHNARCVRRAGIVANQMHNLAFFSVLDFEHFDEDRFWTDLQRDADKYPDFLLGQYKDAFERELDGHGFLGRTAAP